MAERSTSDTRLMYQAQRALNEVPGYLHGLQLRLSDGRRVYLALSATEFSLYFDNDLALHYDLEARLVRAVLGDEYWRHSLSHRVLYSRKRTAAEGGGMERMVLAPDEADTLVANAHSQVLSVYTDWVEQQAATIEQAKPNVDAAVAVLQPMLERAARFDVAAAHATAEQFAKVYGRVAVLPSDQYNALVVQMTIGCGFGGCLFCELYKGVSYHVRPLAEFQQHVQEVIRFHGEALRSRRSIFLGDANALQAPQRVVVDDLQYLHSQFEFPPPSQEQVPASWWLGHPNRFDGITSFLDVFSGEPRSAMDYTELRRLGLRRVYIGMESGSDALLQWLRKPARQANIHRTVATLKEAGINVGVIILIGAGGLAFYKSHVRDTIQSLNALPLGKGDYIYFSPLVIYPGGSYERQMRELGIEPLTPPQLQAQELEIRAGLRFSLPDPHHRQPYFAHYEIENFVY